MLVGKRALQPHTVYTAPGSTSTNDTETTGRLPNVAGCRRDRVRFVQVCGADASKPRSDERDAEETSVEVASGDHADKREGTGIDSFCWANTGQFLLAQRDIWVTARGFGLTDDTRVGKELPTSVAATGALGLFRLLAVAHALTVKDGGAVAHVLLHPPLRNGGFVPTPGSAEREIVVDSSLAVCQALRESKWPKKWSTAAKPRRLLDPYDGPSTRRSAKSSWENAMWGLVDSHLDAPLAPRAVPGSCPVFS